MSEILLPHMLAPLAIRHLGADTSEEWKGEDVLFICITTKSPFYSYIILLLLTEHTTAKSLVMSKGQPQDLKSFNRFIGYKLRIDISLFCNKQKWSYDQPLNNIQRLKYVNYALCHYSPRVMRGNPKGFHKGQNVRILELIFFFKKKRKSKQTIYVKLEKHT